MLRASPTIERVRELTAEDLAAWRPAKSQLRKIRDSHHTLARLCAAGLAAKDVALAGGFSYEYVKQLGKDPAFIELVAQYRETMNGLAEEALDEYYQTIASIRTKTARLISDKLDAVEDPGDISFRELAMLHSDVADRTGYPKRSVAVNVNVDFAARLDQAIQRSNRAKLISGGVQPPPPPAGGEQGTGGPRPAPAVIDHEPIKRRA